MNDLLTIQNKIYEIRGQKVMLDFDLAELYGVKTSRLNEQVKRNIERFPEDFMFQLTKGELENIRNDIWISQIATSNFAKMGLRKAPYAFTENGVAMLSSVLRFFLKLVPHYLFREYIWLLNTIIPAPRHLFQQCASLYI